MGAEPDAEESSGVHHVSEESFGSNTLQRMSKAQGLIFREKYELLIEAGRKQDQNLTQGLGLMEETTNGGS